MTNEELVYLYQQGDKKALDKLVEQNTGIVYKIANKFYVEKTNSVDKEDLEQEGFIGLITAAKKYDFNNPKKANFITYAIHWIYQRISRFINQKNTNEEISLYTPTTDDTALMDTVEDTTDYEVNVIEEIYQEELKKDLHESMHRINTLKEREILYMYYGLDGIEPMNMREIGEVFNIKSNVVRRDKEKALIKLRSKSFKLPIKKYKEELQQERNYKRYDNVKELVNWL